MPTVVLHNRAYREKPLGEGLNREQSYREQLSGEWSHRELIDKEKGKA
jgi:hypothetical protein